MIKCKKCDFETDVYSKLYRHIQKVHKQTVLEYMCEFKGEQDGKCLTCGNETTFLGLRGWRKFCSNPRCSQVHESTKEKKKENSLKKYGTEHPGQAQEIIDKRNATNLEKYGKIGFNNREKYIQTCFDKFGVENPFQIPEVKEKLIDSLTKNKESIKEKRKTTNLERYGVDNTFQTPEAREKCKKSHTVETVEKQKQTKLEKYGDSCYVNIDKRRQTCLERYGSINVSNKHIAENFRNKEFILKNFVKDKKFDKENFMEHFNCSESMVYKLKDELSIQIPNTHANSSKYEKEIQEFIPESVPNDRNVITPLELDIYSEKYNFAVEYDGLMYHSFGKSKYKKFDNINENNDKHLVKTEKCENKGIQLFHIFENEFLNPYKKETWESIISSKMRKHKTNYNLKISTSESTQKIREFVKINSLHDFQHADIHVCLLDGEKIVQVVSFTETDSKNYKIVNMCSENFKDISYEKTFKYFDDFYKPESITAFADRRWTYKNDNFFTKNNFKLIEIIGPQAYFFESGKVNTLSNTKTLNTDRKIYDCGFLKYVKTKS